MRKPPPGMNNMPLKPGETKAQYMDRVSATKPSGRSPVKPVPPAPTGGGRGRGGMTPPPGMMYGPNDRLIPIPKKGGAGTGGGRPRHMGPGSGLAPKPGMKRGGMVKGKK